MKNKMTMSRCFHKHKLRTELQDSEVGVRIPHRPLRAVSLMVGHRARGGDTSSNLDGDATQ